MDREKREWIIAARNPAFGIEGEARYFGTELGATRAANKISRAAGYNWEPIVRPADGPCEVAS